MLLLLRCDWSSSTASGEEDGGAGGGEGGGSTREDSGKDFVFDRGFSFTGRYRGKTLGSLEEENELISAFALTSDRSDFGESDKNTLRGFASSLRFDFNTLFALVVLLRFLVVDGSSNLRASADDDDSRDELLGIPYPPPRIMRGKE